MGSSNEIGSSTRTPTQDRTRSRDGTRSQDGTRSAPPRRVDPSEVDQWRWVGAPLEDQSADADYRRQVADLAREVLASLASDEDPDRPLDRVPDPVPDRYPGDKPGDDPDRDPIPRSRGRFDLRATTPYRLTRTYRRLARGLTDGRRGARAGSGTVLVRDLVLMEVARSHPATPAGLRRRLGIPASTLSAVIESCVRRGLVGRRRHPADGRRWLIDATPAGLEHADLAARSWRAADEAIAGALSPIERDQLRWLLKRVGSALARAGL